jgi:endonuclease/exonuclease/phosphatase family metal-dependent hydrolase
VLISQPTHRPVRVATFNVENLDLPVEARLPVLRPALERLEADILCLQEVNGQRVSGQRERALTALEAVLSGTRYESYQRVATHGHGREGVADVHNLVTLSRFPIASHTQVLHDLVPPISVPAITAEPPASEPLAIRFERPALHAVIETPAGPVHVVNVHLRAPIASPIAGQKDGPFTWKSVRGWAEGYYHAGLKRIAQALELRLLVDRILDADGEARILLTGDFNAVLFQQLGDQGRIAIHQGAGTDFVAGSQYLSLHRRSSFSSCACSNISPNPPHDPSIASRQLLSKESSDFLADRTGG